MTNAKGRRSDTGFVSVEFLVAVCFSLLFMVYLSNFILIQYGRGLMRAAVDEGARAGARVTDNPVGNCEVRIADVLDGMGGLGRDITYSCSVVGEQMQATAVAAFQPWVPGVPTISSEATAYSVKEEAPQ